MLSKHLSHEPVEVTLRSLKKLASLVWQSADVARSELRGKEVLAGLVVSLIGIHLYYRHKYSYWSKNGVKSPPALPFVGNLYAYFINSRKTVDRQWAKRYGKLFGFYLGTKPMIGCADVDLMNQICIKDFSKFRNHSPFGIQNRYEENFLFVMKDDDWHTMRSILSPTFSSGKMKIMFKLIDRCADELIEAFFQKIKASHDNKPVINPIEMFRLFGINASLSSFYSINNDDKSEEAKAKRDALVKNSKLVTNISLVRLVISFLLPEDILRAVGFTTNSIGPLKFFDETTRAIMESRRKSGKKYSDYLQTLLDLESSQPIERTDSETNESHHGVWEAHEHQSFANRTKGVKLSNEQIIAQIMTFLATGGETVGHVVSNTLLVLAHNPDIQARLYDEIASVKLDPTKSGSTFDYEQLSSLQYLDAVISETLRCMPLALVSDRVATEDYHVPQFGATIPKGTVVNLLFDAVMHDPDNWPEPDKFDPERFSAENKKRIKPGSYCPFGVGPRFCLAFRFAIMETKLSLARLMLAFEFKPGPGSEFPLEPTIRDFTFSLSRNLLIPVARSS